MAAKQKAETAYDLYLAMSEIERAEFRGMLRVHDLNATTAASAAPVRNGKKKEPGDGHQKRVAPPVPESMAAKAEG